MLDKDNLRDDLKRDAVARITERGYILAQRNNVDLPEPAGPQSTLLHPRGTARTILTRAKKSPSQLDNPATLIAAVVMSLPPRPAPRTMSRSIRALTRERRKQKLQ